MSEHLEDALDTYLGDKSVGAKTRETPLKGEIEQLAQYKTESQPKWKGMKFFKFRKDDGKLCEVIMCPIKLWGVSDD